MKILYPPLIILFLVRTILSQSFDELNRGPIKGFTSSPLNGKVLFTIDYSRFHSNELYDENGKILIDGEIFIDTLITGDTLTIDTLKFNFNQRSLNFTINYLGNENAGFYLTLPFILSRTFNNETSIKGLGDLGFGVYFLWEEIFKIQRIKTNFFYKRAKSGLPGDPATRHSGNGQSIVGFNFAMDLFFSTRLSYFNNFIYSWSSQGRISVSDSISIVLNPSSNFDYMTRIRYKLSKKLSLALDYEYHSFASLSNNLEQTTGYYNVVKPKIGYRLLNNINFGYLSIKSLNVVWEYYFIVSGKNSFKPHMYTLTTFMYFE